MGDAKIGIAAAGDQSRHASAEAVTPRVRSKRDDFAGDFQAEHISYARRGRIVALALMDIGSVDAGGLASDQNLALRRNRTRAHLDFERLRTARAGRDNCAHSLAVISHVMLPASVRPALGAWLHFVNRRAPKPSPHPPGERRETREALRRGRRTRRDWDSGRGPRG